MKETKKGTKKRIKIKKEDNLAKVVFKYPKAGEVLVDYGLHCIGCIASEYDTIEEGAKIHGLSAKDINEMIARINEVVNFGE